MPAMLLHMTVAREARAHAEASDAAPELGELLASCREHDDAFLFGSVLPDLPYHARFARQVVRHLLKMGYRHSEWGDVFHTRFSGRLGLAMIAHVRRALLSGRDRGRALAMTCGYLCHVALDTAVHPSINRVVARGGGGAPDEPTDVRHGEVERLQSLLYHYLQRGEDITGTPYARTLVGAMAGAGVLRPRLDASLWGTLRSALLQTHARAPSQAELSDWLWGVTVYSQLISSPAGRATEGLGGNIEAQLAAHLDGPDVDLATPLSHGIERTCEHWRAAAAALEAESWGDDTRAAFLERVPDADLDLGY
ncbi:MAG: zinc dependent phospholipase C family protein [Myxococcales bacterium]|nr:zinc dependent phospholipase C family protein [Myxococcales bacterium]